MNIQINFKDAGRSAINFEVDVKKFEVAIHENAEKSSIEIGDNFSEIGLTEFWTLVKDIKPEDISSIVCTHREITKEITNINNISYNTIFLEGNVEEKIILGF